MKRIILSIAFLACFAASAFGQGAPPWTIQEVDGSPRVNSPTLIKVTNGTLSCTGKTCTITISGGGGGSPGGASGTVQWNDSGAFNGTSGLTATATTVTVVSGVTETFSRAGLLYTGTVTTDNASVQTQLIQGDRATATANDEAYITYRLSNASGTQTEVARLTWAIPTATAASENGRLDFSVMTGGALAKELQLAGADLSPSTSDGLALGTTSLMWSDLFLASGAVVNFNAGNVVLTHSAGILTMGTGELRITTVGTNAASVPTLGSTSTLTNKTLTTPTIGSFTNANHDHSNSAGGGQIAVSAGISGLGTGVATALGVNVGSAGAFVTFNGALGTPSSGTLTNATGLPPATGIVGWPANASGCLSNDGAGALSWAACSGGGSGLTVGTTTVTSGSAGRVFYETAGNVLGEISTLTSDGTIVTFAPTVTTGSGATSGLNATANSLTTGDAFTFSSSSVTAGNVVSIAATGTAAASNTKTALRVATSGANATSAMTTFGGRFSNTSTGTTSINIGLQGAASGGATNYDVAVGDGTAATSILTSNLSGANDANIRFGNGSIEFNAANTGNQLQLNSGAATLSVGNSAQIGWAAASFGGNTNDTAFVRVAAAGVRVSNASTGAGNFMIGTSAAAIGTSGAGVLAFTLSTAPSTSPTDTVQFYSADSAAADHNVFSRNEAGEINRVTGLGARNSSAFTATSSTTLTNITGLTRNVEANRVYGFRAVLQTTAVATGGVKLAVSGTATATAINYVGILLDGTVIVANTRATALDTTVCAATTSTAGTCEITGTITVNAAGTLTIQFAQNNSDGSASTVLANQYFQLIPIT